MPKAVITIPSHTIYMEDMNITLSAENSTDSDGKIVSYSWYRHANDDNSVNSIKDNTLPTHDNNFSNIPKMLL